jgi:DNA replication protein DnaC
MEQLNTKELTSEIFGSISVSNKIENPESQIEITDFPLKAVEEFGLRYKQSTFDNYKIYDDRQKEVVDKCKNYVNIIKNKNQGEGLFLVGNSGTGKDHLCVSIARNFKNYIVKVFEEIHVEKLTAMSNQKNWHVELDKYIHTPILFVLDFCSGKELTDSQKETFFYILNKRYNNLLPIIITTNVPQKDFKTLIEFQGFNRNIDRFNEIFGKDRVLICEWESYRK